MLKALLGNDFNGIIVCDFFSANKKFIHDLGLRAQFCFAHLIRDLKFLTTLPQKIVASWSEALLRILRNIFKSWKFLHSIDPDRYRWKIEKLRKAFLRRIRRPPWQTDAMWTLVATCTQQGKSVFHFLRQAIISTYTSTPYPKLIG